MSNCSQKLDQILDTQIIVQNGKKAYPVYEKANRLLND